MANSTQSPSTRRLPRGGAIGCLALFFILLSIADELIWLKSPSMIESRDIVLNKQAIESIAQQVQTLRTELRNRDAGSDPALAQKLAEGIKDPFDSRPEARPRVIFEGDDLIIYMRHPSTSTPYDPSNMATWEGGYVGYRVSGPIPEIGPPSRITRTTEWMYPKKRMFSRLKYALD